MMKPTRGILLNTTHPLARGLVSCWLMNEGTGNKIVDYSRMGIDLTAYNTPVWSAGRKGHALLFDDVSSEYLQSDKCPVTNSDNITMISWFNINDLSVHQVIMQVCDKDTADNYHLILFYATSNVLRAATYANGVYRMAPSTITVTANKWHMAAAIFKGDEYREIYLDAGNNFSDSFKVTFAQQFDRMSVGGARDSTPGTNMSGKIGLAMIWKRALSDIEIALLYREPFCMFDVPVQVGVIGSVVPITETPDVLASELTLQTPTIICSSTISPSALVLAGILETPSILYDWTQTASVLAGSLTLEIPAVAIDYVDVPSTQVLALTVETPTILISSSVSPGTLALEAALEIPTYTSSYTATPSVLVLEMTLETPDLLYDFVQVVSALDATLSLKTPTILADMIVLPDAIALELTLETPQVSTVGETIITFLGTNF